MRGIKRIFTAVLAIAVVAGILTTVPVAAYSPYMTTVIDYGEYDGIGGFLDGTALAYKKDGEQKIVYLLDTGGNAKELCRTEFDVWEDLYGLGTYEWYDAKPYQMVTRISDEDIQSAYITKSGNIYEHCFLSGYQDTLFVCQDGTYSLADKNGVIIKKLPYAYVGTCTEDGTFAAAYRLLSNYNWGVVNLDGDVLVPFEHSYLQYAGEGIWCCDNHLDPAYFVDSNGNRLPGAYYVNLHCKFSEGLTVVSQKGETFNKEYSFIDTTGKVTMKLPYLWAGNFSEGRAPVLGWDKDGVQKYGFIDRTGREVIPCQYDAVGDFHEGLARVRIGGDWGVRRTGYIDTNGQLVIGFMEGAGGDFSNGFAPLVASDYSYQLIDRKGNIVRNSRSECYNYSPMNLDHALLVVTHLDYDLSPYGLTCGLIDYQGNIVLSRRYQQVLLSPDSDLVTVYSKEEGAAVLRYGTEQLWGDANEDGTVNVLDMMAIKRHILRRQPLTGNVLTLADANGDGDINALDMMEIRRYILGKS